MNRSCKKVFKLSLMSALVCFSSNVLASGFQLFEQNVVQTGDAGAGGAAIAEDASTGFYNPAGLTRLQNQQIVFGVNEINVQTVFTGTSTWSSPSAGAAFPTQGVYQRQGGDNVPVPEFHYAIPISDRFVGGFGVTAPFGLSTNYSNNTFLRYFATESKIKTVNLSPSLAYKIDDAFSVGAGFDALRLNAELDLVAGIPVLSTALDTISKNHAADWGYGWHAGALFQSAFGTRIGINFRSQVSLRPKGSSTFKGALANLAMLNPPPLSTDNLRSSIRLPSTSTLSIYQDVTDRWAVEGTVNYTHWSVFRQLRLVNLAGINSTLAPVVNIITNAPEHFSNTWRGSLGTNFKASDRWLIRGGVGYDENPTNNSDRTIRLPDGNRTLLAIGTRFQVTKMVGIDVGWTHLFINNGQINSTAYTGPQQTTVVGKSRNSADIFGAQVTWNIT